MLRCSSSKSLPRLSASEDGHAIAPPATQGLEATPAQLDGRPRRLAVLPFRAGRRPPPRGALRLCHEQGSSCSLCERGGGSWRNPHAAHPCHPLHPLACPPPSWPLPQFKRSAAGWQLCAENFLKRTCKTEHSYFQSLVVLEHAARDGSLTAPQRAMLRLAPLGWLQGLGTGVSLADPLHIQKKAGALACPRLPCGRSAVPVPRRWRSCLRFSLCTTFQPRGHPSSRTCWHRRSRCTATPLAAVPPRPTVGRAAERARGARARLQGPGRHRRAGGGT